MKETHFIDQNKKKWKELEELLQEERKDPDKLSNLFIQVTDDLSYARTFYPNRYVRLYLNNIAQQLFYFIYKNKSSSRSGFVRFWKEELPDLIYSARKELLFSLCFFLVSVAIGVFSSRHDPGFANLILGENYVQSTIENIKKGDPMAVYKKMNSVDMFLGISINNLRVSFIVFIFGLLYCVGTLGILLFNGIMVGVFQYFFISYGLFQESFLTIWLHGTLEISCIIIAGGAGITLGKGLVFPGTYKRSQSFFIGARKSIKILIGIAPIIVMAAIIESYITRYTDAPDIVRLSIIVLSASFILFYFVIYPIHRHRSGKSVYIPESSLQPEVNEEFDYEAIQPTGNIFMEVFHIFKLYGGKIVKWSLLTAALISIGMVFFINGHSPEYRTYFFLQSVFKIFSYENNLPLFFINVLAFGILSFYFLKIISRHANKTFRPKASSLVFTILFSLIINIIIKYGSLPSTLILLFLGPPLMLWLSLTYYKGQLFTNTIKPAYQYFRATRGKSYRIFFVVGFTSLIMFLILQTPMLGFYLSITKWNIYVSGEQLRTITNIFNAFASYFSFFIILPFFIYGNFLGFFSIYQIVTAESLKKKILTLKPVKNSSKS
jgi:uncharacterized membrane protein SpoIIM required for sporulation